MSRRQGSETTVNESSSLAAAAAGAKRWLEEFVDKGKGGLGKEVWNGGFFDSVSLYGLQISRAEGGRALCSFRVPKHVTDMEGNWQAGAIATLIDDVGAMAIMTAVGHIKVSVDFDISYFSPAKIDEEVEIDARIVEHMRKKLTAVVVEIRRKGSGRMVALGRQWMASALHLDQRSNL